MENGVTSPVDNGKITIGASQCRSFSIKLWPPSENTRRMLIVRITDNLTTKSIFTQKYGSLNKEEAEENAKSIEDVAFSTANQHFQNEPDGDGGSAVQVYAKECSKQILEVLKRGPLKKEGSEPLKKEGSEPVEKDGSETMVSQEAVSHDDVFDISKGQRSFIEAEEAEEILRPLKEIGSSHTKICFSNRSFGIESARVAEPILTSIKNQLKEVDLSDFIAGRPESEALEVIALFATALEGSSLKCLNLSNNALGEKGVRAFRALLQSQSDLEERYLMNDGISVEAAKAVFELIPSTKKLRILHFHNSMSGVKGAVPISEMVKCSPLLEDFRCSSTRIGSSGGIALSEALGTCTNLKRLDLRDNMFGTEAGLVLSKALSAHSHLAEVYLSYLNLEDDGCLSIINSLKESAPLLDVLEMAGNDITAEAAPAIAACLSSMQHLTKLNLAENELKDEGVIYISNAIGEGHAKLKEVDFSNNSIGRSGARVLAQMVIQKPSFTILNINGNFISDDGIDDLKHVFKQFPDKLGPLDENDPEGGQDDEEDEEAEAPAAGDGDDNEQELESKLKNLEVEDD